MRIVFVVNVFPPSVGGSGTVYLNLCRSLDAEVTVITPWRRYQDGSEISGWREFDAAQSFPIRRLESLRPPLRTAPRHPSLIQPLFSAWRHLTEDQALRLSVRRFVFEALEHTRAEVVVLGDLAALSWLGQEIRNRFRLPVVQIVHGEEVTVPVASWAWKREVQQALRNVDAVVAVSSFTRDYLSNMGVDANRLHLITNGVDIGRFTPGPPDPAIAARHGLEGRRVLMTIARLEERKGHDQMIRAMPQILRSASDAIYVIAGDGPYRSRLEQLVRDLSLTRHVVFAGSVPEAELVHYYRACDLFVMPNRTLANGDTEGFGLVFLEAAACGKPVVGGYAGGVPDAVADGVTGFLVNGESVDEIAEHVITVLRDKALSRRLADNGLSHARTNSWNRKATQFLTLCASIASSGNSAARRSLCKGATA